MNAERHIFLTFIADRLVHVHGDDANLDFVQALRRMAKEDAAWSLVNRLREGEGDSVTICCDNPDPEPGNGALVTCNGWWTDWKDREYRADTVLECLQRAAADLDQQQMRLRTGSRHRPAHHKGIAP